ncbi:glycosyl hydrolase [Novosphingobium sp. MMS21-SN21R]|uniref:glycosyl hydrolase n=1 Tax=Novosphingobium sp. MMS21-SN21R TaxID=2969298 RepID=UPI00288561DB|nr:glycosyl hydrolase [Novosphingobium sp. MMS21-SN21R]MDT0508393.1 hypothetical protein [Novosphingobium sp. MMS21-SN21R]
MIRRGCSLGAIAATVLATGCDAAPAAPPAPLRLGATAHFAQGWPERLWPAIGAVRAMTVREALGWRRVETRRGQYQFTPQNSAHVTRLCAMKLPVVLVIDPRNPLYDSGATANSDQAQAAFGTFVANVADHFRNCLAAIEVGNEINGASAMDGLAASDRARSHTRLMKAVWQATKPHHARVALLGGSVNTVGTGFLEALFAQGLLSWVDGIAVHPYRRTPEGLDWELAELRSAMARHGPVRPIWATEFGMAAPDQAEAADYLLRMAVLLSASGVREAQWYALADDPSFPTMGLVGANAEPKPAAATFRMLSAGLLGRGPAIRRSTGEPALYRYRFGGDREVLWGAPRSLSLPSGAVVRDSTGRAMQGPVRVGPSPIIVESPQEAELGPGEVLADSLYDYATPVWAYSATGVARDRVGLSAVHSKFATTLGFQRLGALAVNPLGMVLPAGRERVAAAMQYSVRKAARIIAEACLAPKPSGTGAAKFSVTFNSEPGQFEQVPPSGLHMAREIEASAGDTISFRARASGGPAVIAYRYRIVLAGTPAAQETLRCN